MTAAVVFSCLETSPHSGSVVVFTGRAPMGRGHRHYDWLVAMARRGLVRALYSLRVLLSPCCGSDCELAGWPARLLWRTSELG